MLQYRLAPNKQKLQRNDNNNNKLKHTTMDLLMILCCFSQKIARYTIGFVLGVAMTIVVTLTPFNNQKQQIEQLETTVMQADSLLNKHNIWDADDSDLMERYSTNFDKLMNNE